MKIENLNKLKKINQKLRKNSLLRKLKFNEISEYLILFVLYNQKLGIQNGSKYYFINKFKKKGIIKIKNKKFKHPIYLRANTSDILTFEQILILEEFTYKIKNTPKIIIDLGANIGTSTIYFVNKFPSARIISLEPEKSNFKILEKNTSKYKNISIINKGIWSKKANLEIINENCEKYSFRFKESNSKKNFEAISINTIIKENSIKKIDILKIDIEGTEKELFSKNLKWIEKTKLIFVEPHENYVKGCEKTIFEIAKKYNFKTSKLGEYIVLEKK